MKKKGFTLIELMITLALFSLFVGFLYNAYFTQIRENNSFNTKLDLKYNGDKAMSLITEELRSNVDFKFISGSNGNINQITTIDDHMLIALDGGAKPSNLSLTSQNTLVDNSNSIPVVLCSGITSITMKPGVGNESDLVIIKIDLQLKDDSYTVTTAVNINK